MFYVVAYICVYLHIIDNIMKRFNKIAGSLYLDFLVAINYPEQEPEYINAKWHDLFWLLIPIIGVFIFCEKISNRPLNKYN